MRSERYFVERGQPLKIDLIVADLDGNAIAGQPIQVGAARLEWKFENGEWAEKEADVQECKLESAEEPVTCEFETPVGGRYRITRWCMTSRSAATNPDHALGQRRGTAACAGS